MPRTRVRLDVYVDLDPVPGAFHSMDSARNCVGAILRNGIPQYNPLVSVGEVTSEPDPNQPQFDFSKDN